MSILKRVIQTQMNHSTQESLSDRAILVLNVAKELFLQHGYEKTSLDMVIKGAGGSRRTVYAEFGNKQQLFQAVILRKIDELQQNLRQLNTKEDPQTVLINMGTEFLSVLLAPDSLAMFRLMVGNVTRLPEVGKEVYQAGPPIGIKPLAEYLGGLQQQGLIQVEDTEQASHLLMAMFKGHIHIRAMLDPDYVPSREEVSEHVQHVVKVFFHGIKAS